jgi:hypothetical protein
MHVLRQLIQWINFKLEASQLETLLDVECPHDPLDPCEDCFNMERALGW